MATRQVANNQKQNFSLPVEVRLPDRWVFPRVWFLLDGQNSSSPAHTQMPEKRSAVFVRSEVFKRAVGFVPGTQSCMDEALMAFEAL